MVKPLPINNQIRGTRRFAAPDSVYFRTWFAQQQRKDRKEANSRFLLDSYPGAAAAYSLRPLSTSTTSVIQVRRSSDNTEQDFTASQITDGTLVSFCGTGDGLVTTWYDQSGNGNNAVQNQAPDLPRIVVSGSVVQFDGKPAVEYTSNLEALYVDVSGLSGKVGYLVGSALRYQEVVIYDTAESGAKTAIAGHYGFEPNEIDGGLSVALALNYTGAPVAGGYYAGLIDTLTGNIIAADDYQTGLRYALIVSDKSLEGGRGASPASGLPTGDLEWDTTRGGGEAGCFTRWNGLEATNVIIAKNDTSYEVHDFIEAVRSQYPAATTPGGSEWYLPAMDELELLYRNFKPDNADNDTRDFPRNFPGSNPSGKNLSSVPEGFNYENNPRIPDVTYLDLFKEGNAQSLDQLRYWSTTDADEDGRAWVQFFPGSGFEGFQTAGTKDFTSRSVRPVRRVVL